MKKILIALSVLAAMAFGTVPAQALIGTPDAVPGTRVLVPFFIVSMSGYGNEDTLVSITETGKATNTFKLEWYTYNKRSGEAQDFETTMTPKDVHTQTVSTMLDDISSDSLASYEYDLDGDTVNDAYIGYIDFFVAAANQVDAKYDGLTGTVLLYDLAAGKAGAYVAASKERASSLFAAQYASQADTDAVEAFSPDAYVIGQDLLAGNAGTTSASWFQLSPRYYLLNSAAQNYYFIWSDRNVSTNGNTVHVQYYDEAETNKSKDITIPDELTVLNVKTEFVPSGGTTYPFAGWIDITMTNTYQLGSTEWLGYNYMLASGAASETWLAISEIHRDASTTSTKPGP